MADQLEGLKLRAVRALVERPLTRKVLWKAVAEDFGLSLMQALPASELGPVEQVPKPVQGRAPRQWGGEPLDPPTSHRTTAADLRRAYADGRTTPVERVLGVGSCGPGRDGVAGVREDRAEEEGVEDLRLEEKGTELVVRHVLDGPAGDMNVAPDAVGEGGGRGADQQGQGDEHACLGGASSHGALGRWSP